MVNLQRGFTLIEVIVAVTILATLSILSSRNIQEGIKTKTKLHEQIEDMGKVRDALRIIERDINLAYHYRDTELEFLAQVNCLSKNSPPPAATPPPNPAMPNFPQQPQNPNSSLDACTNAFISNISSNAKFRYRKDPTTHFIGVNESIDFATMNVSRVSETQIMADFAKVGYALKKCVKLDDTSGGQCLVRRQAAIVEGDITKGGEETVLLDNVTEFKLRYFGKGKQDWVTEWKSKDGGDSAMTNNYPQAVEISLSTEIEKVAGNEKKKKTISMQLVASIHFPNNKDNGNNNSNTGLPSGH